MIISKRETILLLKLETALYETDKVKNYTNDSKEIKKLFFF